MTHASNVLPQSENFLGLEAGHSRYDTSGIVIISAPYERTVSYGGGTADGPQAILEASHYVEFWDEEYRRELCFEQGIATLDPLSFDDLSDINSLHLLEDAVRLALKDGKFVVTLGGEHTISQAPVLAHLERHPGMSVLQFDAHADLRDTYEGSPLSHACVMARILECISPEQIVQAGIRALSKEEAQRISNTKIHTHYAHDLKVALRKNWDALDAVVADLRDEVYITFDIDCFDPSIMQSTGTPEPNGMYWEETVELIRRVAASKRIVGFDVVELAPAEGNHADPYLAAKLVYKMLNAAFTSR